ncbi:hypothetical protein GALMADRAFT_231587 [Galerina marginata CBS 339.88]|uniref:Uncharacterized protein n=1 Tax=Galerina marginata (strain CBS 339.88) TaxID=685588 RepID=A0A067SJU1_GALM3|nr:hypothetical protein GALMADRAFT_231587 [Galerina marginata CBS 339.88]
MPSAHSYTIVAHDDGDDSDICPVCDGECTCRRPPPPPTPTIKSGVPLSMAELSLHYATGGSSPTPPASCSSGQPYPPTTPTPASTPTPAPLKIKLTVPPGMLKRRPTSSKSPEETMSDVANAGYNSASTDPPRPPPKKRGRPPKLVRPAPQPPHSPVYKPLNPKSAAPGKQQQHKRAAPTKARQNLKARAAAIVKKVSKKKRRAATSDEESDVSDLSDVDMDMAMDHPVVRRGAYNDYDMESVQFPTFVSASALSSMSSYASDSSSLSDFDSDSSIEAEEENFIVTDMHDKARLRRELLGGDDALLLQKKRSNRNNDWVIRPRKKSVGPSDVEMDVDSDATEDDDEEEEDENDEVEADEETEEEAIAGVPTPQPQEEEEDTDDHRSRYVGLATGWSEDDDESSFDADLFFANLYGTSDSSSNSSSDTDDGGPHPSLAEDGDQSDLSCASERTEGGLGSGHRHRRLESLPFEVTQGWDGQVVFTNGVHDERGLVDLEFEKDASRFVASPGQYGDADEAAGGKPRRRRVQRYLGLGMPMSMSDAEDSDVAMLAPSSLSVDSDGGYEEDGELECDSGDTTDEELVGADALPNARAMALFSLPAALSVHAINPLSTVSTPAVSPGRRRRQDEASRERRRRRWGGGNGPCAVDILQGKVLFWDSDEQEIDGEDDEWAGIGVSPGSALGEPWGGINFSPSPTGRSGSTPGTPGGGGKSHVDVLKLMRRARTPTGPRKGVFEPSTETRQAVIGEDRMGAEVPSPHPRFRKRERNGGRFGAVEHLLRKHLLQSLAASTTTPGSVGSVSALGSPSSSGPAADERSSLELLLSSAVNAGGDEDAVTALQMQMHVHGEAEPIQLDDVLDASFLDDDDPPSPSTVDSAADAASPLTNTDPAAADDSTPISASTSASAFAEAAEEAGAKNLSRWDLISVGAFRHGPHGHGHGHVHGHTPGSSADFGSAMRSSPISTMWQGVGGMGVGTGGARMASSGSAVAIKGKGSKLAKRRRIMMGGSTMSSPLILPLGSASASASASASGSPSSSMHTTPTKHLHHRHQDQSQKNRKEQRRERKLLKRRSSNGHGYPAPHTPHLAHQQHHAHAFHMHQHHPNAKLRGASSAQRSNFFAAGVPPLNL